MSNEPRIYRNSPFQIGLIALIFGVLGVGLLTTIDSSDYVFLIPLLVVIGVIFLILMYSMTTKTAISENEISTQTLLGTKTLAWNEISRVSGTGNSIKLHNNFGDVTVAPSKQLPGYDEIVNWIGTKRPDLFNPLEHSEMSRSWINTIFLAVFGLLFVGLGFFVFTQSEDFLFPLLMCTIVGAIFIGMMFTSTQHISIQGNSIVIGYLFNQRTLAANEIASIDLRFTQTRNGKNYFVAITLMDKKVVRVSGISPSLPVVYLVLKNWHQKNSTMGLTTQQK